MSNKMNNRLYESRRHELYEALSRKKTKIKNGHSVWMKDAQWSSHGFLSDKDHGGMYDTASRKKMKKKENEIYEQGQDIVDAYLGIRKGFADNEILPLHSPVNLRKAFDKDGYAGLDKIKGEKFNFAQGIVNFKRNLVLAAYDAGNEEDYSYREANKVLRHGELLVQNYFDSGRKIAIKTANKMGVDITKELKNIDKQKYVDIKAQMLADVMNVSDLRESYRPRGRRLNEDRSHTPRDLYEASGMSNNYERIDDLLKMAKKKLPKEKRLHKEIKKIRTKTYDVENMFFGVREYFKRSYITRIDWHFRFEEANILNILESVWYCTKRDLEDIIDDSSPNDTFLGAYKNLGDAKIYLENVVAAGISRVERNAKENGRNITKELKKISSMRNLEDAARELVNLVDDAGLTED